jgi:NAD(P)H dehydrogenase (quinone)
MYHWGALVVTPGYTDPVIFGAGGNPYGTSVTVDQNGKMIKRYSSSCETSSKTYSNSC